MATRSNGITKISNLTHAKLAGDEKFKFVLYKQGKPTYHSHYALTLTSNEYAYLHQILRIFFCALIINASTVLAVADAVVSTTIKVSSAVVGTAIEVTKAGVHAVTRSNKNGDSEEQKTEKK